MKSLSHAFLKPAFWLMKKSCSWDFLRHNFAAELKEHGMYTRYQSMDFKYTYIRDVSQDVLQKSTGIWWWKEMELVKIGFRSKKENKGIVADICKRHYKLLIGINKELQTNEEKQRCKSILKNRKMIPSES